MKIPPTIDWRKVDELPGGHGVVIYWEPDDGTQIAIAFIDGFRWRHGAEPAAVYVLRDLPDRRPVLDGAAVDQLRRVVQEVCDGGSLMLRRGEFVVIANA